jgi:hypothetical protein
MITITELKDLLKANTAFLELAIKNQDCALITELTNHRAVIKDTLIERLEFALFQAYESEDVKRQAYLKLERYKVA